MNYLSISGIKSDQRKAARQPALFSYPALEVGSCLYTFVYVRICTYSYVYSFTYRSLYGQTGLQDTSFILNSGFLATTALVTGRDYTMRSAQDDPKARSFPMN